MNKFIAIGTLVAGVIVAVVGFAMSKSVTTTVYPYYSGGMTPGTIVLLIVGLLGIIVGIVGFMRGPKEE
jgi:uncharacterized membrane protein HdeD (DUF308 family)